jgi:hypothetical protein
VLLEKQSRHVRHRRLAVIVEDEAIDDCKANLRVIDGHLTHDRRLSEADADDEVVSTLGERAHGGLDRVGCARLNIPEHDSQ